MTRRILILASLLTFAFAVTASARYYVKHHARCRTHFVRRVVHVRKRHHGRLVRRHHRVVWVRQVRCVYVAPKHRAEPKPTVTQPAPTLSAPVTPATPAVSYQAHVDPTLTQAPADPLAVTYGYSASATSTSGGLTTNLATTGALPAGILNFYSQQTPGGPESLYCSMNVGGAATSGDCPIKYATTGDYQVTTQYIPSAASAVTETDTETVSPYATTLGFSTQPGTLHTTVGPPPINMTGTYNSLAIDVTSSDPAPQAITITITDQATDQTVTTTVPANPGNPGYLGAGVMFTQETSPNPGPIGMSLGESSMNVGANDMLLVNVATAGSMGYTGSSAPPQTISVPSMS